MRTSKHLVTWVVIGLFASLLFTPITPVRAESGTPPAPNTQTLPQPYVPPLHPPAPAAQSPASGRAALSGQAAPEAATLAAASAIVSNPVVDMKVLVVYRPGDADGVFAMVKGYLDNLGIPYATLDTSQAAPAGTLEASDLGDGVSRGYYYAVFITTSNIWAALSPAEKTALTDYERAFGVREVTWYAYPNPSDYGLDFAATTYEGCGGPAQGIPFTAALTAAGQAAFGYLRPDVALSIEGPCMYGYLGQPAAGADVTPLLVNGAGATFLAVYRPGDGREIMTMTEGSFYPAIPPAYLHAQVLPYGMINWATRGVFLGERHVYFVPQPDDVLGWGDRWDAVTHSYIFDTGYRNTPADLDNLVAWQNAFRVNTRNASGFRIEMPFNGEGSLEDREGGVAGGAVLPGTLTAKAQEVQGSFTWLNHTYTHRDMGNTSLQVSTDEIALNTATAANLGFTDYSNQTLLTGDYSGTNPPNANLATAAYDQGVRYLLVNASVAGFNNPTPNTGIPHPTRPAILQVPRYANNIYYAVTTPEEETDLYNWLYCAGYAANPATTPRCYDYNYIMDSVTGQALRFMLDYSVNASMFHMNNFNNYGGGRTVMTDFVEALYAKYNALYGANVPVLSLRTQEIGQKMRERMAYNASGVSGQLACGNQITLKTNQKATIPLTGVSYGNNVEIYAGQPISSIAMGANATVVIPGGTPKAPAAITGLTATLSGSDVVLNWPAVTQATDASPLKALLYRVYARANDPGFTPTPADLVAEVTDTTYTHVGGGDAAMNYSYVVTSIGDNCWKLESAPSIKPSFLGQCVFGWDQGAAVSIEEFAQLDCSVGSVGKADIKKDAKIQGDVFSLANEVGLDSRAFVGGTIVATGKVGLNDSASVAGSVTSRAEINLKRDVKIAGDATSAGRVVAESGAVVSGITTEYAGANIGPALPVPPVNFAIVPGNKDITVKRETPRTLAPGSYKKLNVESNGTITLAAGVYVFEEVVMNNNGVINLDLRGGSLRVDVLKNLELRDRVRMILAGPNDRPRDALFRILGGTVKLKKEGRFVGTFLAPNAGVVLEDGATLTGALYGKKVQVKSLTSLKREPALQLYADLFSN